MSKITKEIRYKNSQLRQALSQKIEVWQEKINFLKNAKNHGVPGAESGLAFATKELEACRVEIRKINKGQAKQRVWVQGKY